MKYITSRRAIMAYSLALISTSADWENKENSYLHKVSHKYFLALNNRHNWVMRLTYWVTYLLFEKWLWKHIFLWTLGNCYEDPVVIHDPYSPASQELIDFCRSKCQKRHDELGHWSHAYVAEYQGICNVNCICIKEKSKNWVITLRNGMI